MLLEIWRPETWSEWMGIVALGLAIFQLAAADWRDIGIVTICAASASVVLSQQRSVILLACLAATAVVAALAWQRASQHGIGRPGLTGAGLAIGVGSVCLRWALPEVAPGVIEHRATAMLICPCIVAGLVGFSLACERPSPRPTRQRWFRKIPIEEVVDRKTEEVVSVSSSSEAPAGAPQ